jgi:hypothetical protein
MPAPQFFYGAQPVLLRRSFGADVLFHGFVCGEVMAFGGYPL